MNSCRWFSAVVGLMLVWTAGVALAGDLEIARSHQTEGDRLFNSGKPQAAIEPYNKALGMFEQLALPSNAAVIRHQLGFAYWALGDYPNAIRYFEQNMTFHEQRGDHVSAANYFQYTGHIFLEMGDLEMAAPRLERARDYLSRDLARLAEVDHLRIALQERRGNLDEAKTILETAHATVDDESWRRHLAQDAERLGVAAKYNTARDPATAKAYALLSLLAVVTALWIAAKLGYLGPWFKNLTLTVISVVVALIIAEIALRLVLPKPPVISHLLHAPNQVTRFFPLPGIMIGVDKTETRFSVNDAGLRGNLLPNDNTTTRILAIGGSSTEALFLDDPDAWPQILQTLLKQESSAPVWVGNAGKSGLNSFGHLTQLFYYKDELHPDIVILQAGINDLNQCISGATDAVRDNARLVRRSDFFAAYQKFVFHEIRPRERRSPWRLVDLYQRAHRSLSEHGAQPSPTPFNFVVQDQSGLFYQEQRQRRHAAKRENRRPDIGECLAAFRYNMDLMAKMARESNIRLILLTQGALYRPDLTPDEENLLWFGSVDANPFAPTPPRVYYTASVLGTLLNRYNEQTLQVCASGAAHCLDVASILPKTTASYYDDVHLNVSGATTLARAVADEIIRARLLPQPK